jgi:GNAT superfamily N-acetyltransferase
MWLYWIEGRRNERRMLEERIRVGQVSRLDDFHARELGCDLGLLHRPGLHVLASERRARPGWGGYTVPLIALSTPRGGIVSCRPDLLDPVRRELAMGPLALGEPLGEAEFERLRRVVRRAVPYAYNLSGCVLYCDPAHFRPVLNEAEPLRAGDPRGLDVRRRFDGEIFALRGARGEIASWAAIKLKSDDVWEIAVVTDSPYRGRGYAKKVVSAATEHILRCGRLALYVHDRTNHASARVCRSLGYVEYAEEFFCEF